jgi:TRAP-type C4-dicarboxylate transport system substrate-binding protein
MQHARAALFRSLILALLFFALLELYGTRMLFAEEPFVLKVATLAPEGTSWIRLFDSMRAEIEQATNGRVSVRMYAGGVMGNDADVLRKIHLGQVHIGGFSAEGTNLAYPQIQVLELPFLVDSYQKADKVRERLRKEIETGFAHRGLVPLAILDQGYNAFYTKDRPVRRIEDAAGLKGPLLLGAVEEATLRALKITPIRFGVMESISALKSGMFNSQLVPAQWVLGTQEFTILKYINLPTMTYCPGSILIAKNVFGSLRAEDQGALRKISRKYETLFNKEARKAEQECYKAFQEYGMAMVQLDKPAEAPLRQATRPLWGNLAGKVYSEKLLKAVIRVASDP